MDILAHTLWANVMAREANAVAQKKNKKFHINVGWTAFFGIFPDLFAFSIPFFLRFFYLLIGDISVSNFWSRPTEGEVFRNGASVAENLYQYSHSLVIWAVVFIIVWFFYKRPRFELLGWALHILIDIPTHVLAFYPTPFLFPLSDYRFQYGMQWSNTYFMIINYGALLLVWGRFLVKDFLAKKVNKI